MPRVPGLARGARTGLVCLALALAAGCGERLVVVRGSVTAKGKPLTNGIVRIHGPGDRLATARIREDGTFALTDVLPGDIKVSVVDEEGGGSSIPPPKGVAQPPGEQTKAARRSRIPPKYQDPETSGLAYTIEPGGGLELDIKLD